MKLNTPYLDNSRRSTNFIWKAQTSARCKQGANNNGKEERKITSLEGKRKSGVVLIDEREALQIFFKLKFGNFN